MITIFQIPSNSPSLSSPYVGKKDYEVLLQWMEMDWNICDMSFACSLWSWYRVVNKKSVSKSTSCMVM